MDCRGAAWKTLCRVRELLAAARGRAQDGHGEVALHAHAAGEAHVVRQVLARDEGLLDVGGRPHLAVDAYAAAPARALAAAVGGDVLPDALAGLEDALPVLHGGLPPLR